MSVTILSRLKWHWISVLCVWLHFVNDILLVLRHTRGESAIRRRFQIVPFILSQHANPLHFELSTVILSRLPVSTLEPLQRILTAAARLVFGLCYAGLNPSAMAADQLQKKDQSIRYSRSSTYRTETVQSVIASRPHSVLRSSSTSSTAALCHGFAWGSASVYFHTWVLPPGMHFQTTVAPWLTLQVLETVKIVLF